MNPYIAVVKEENDGGYYLFFPDMPNCTVYGKDLNESIRKAHSVLNTHINMYVSVKGKEPPKASTYSEIHLRYPCDILQLVPVDPLKDTTPVKKTLSIPAWLDNIGKRYSLSPSKILKEAMIAKLRNQSDLTEREKMELFTEI